MSTQDKPAAPAPSASPVIRGLASFMVDLKAADMKPRTANMKIDGFVYTSTKVNASIGWEMLPRLGTLLGSAVGPLMGEDGAEFDAAVILSVCTRAMQDGMMPTTTDLLQGMECNTLCGIKDQAGAVMPVFGEHFAGEYLHLIKVLVFAFRHNYQGFSRGSL